MRGSVTHLDGDLLCQAPSINQSGQHLLLLLLAPSRLLLHPSGPRSGPVLPQAPHAALPSCVPTSLPVVERAACRQIPITASFRITGSMANPQGLPRGPGTLLPLSEHGWIMSAVSTYSGIENPSGFWLPAHPRSSSTSSAAPHGESGQDPKAHCQQHHSSTNIW